MVIRNGAKRLRSWESDYAQLTLEAQRAKLKELANETWHFWSHLLTVGKARYLSPSAVAFRDVTGYEVREAQEYVAAALLLLAKYDPADAERTKKIVGSMKLIARLNEVRKRQDKLFEELTRALQHEAISHGVDPITLKEGSDATAGCDSGELQKVPPRSDADP